MRRIPVFYRLLSETVQAWRTSLSAQLTIDGQTFEVHLWLYCYVARPTCHLFIYAAHETDVLNTLLFQFAVLQLGDVVDTIFRFFSEFFLSYHSVHSYYLPLYGDAWYSLVLLYSAPSDLPFPINK